MVKSNVAVPHNKEQKNWIQEHMQYSWKKSYLVMSNVNQGKEELLLMENWLTIKCIFLVHCKSRYVLTHSDTISLFCQIVNSL